MDRGSAEPAGGGPRRVRVFLLDDQEAIRSGLRNILDSEPDIEVVGEAGTVAAALDRMPGLRPDVAVLDVRLPDGDGVSVCREIRSALPGTACLMLTAYGDDRALLGAIMAGAAGYMLKGSRGSDLVGAVRAVAGGRSMLDPRAAQVVLRRLREQIDAVDPLAALSAQERHVLDLVAQGLTNRQIAESLSVEERAAREQVSSLLARLGLRRRSRPGP